MTRTVLCFAHGRDDAWEAICLDYDIAVAGRSFEEVKALLGRAIETYVEDAGREAEPHRSALMRRRAPFLVRLRHVAGFVASALLHRSDDREARFGFSMPCPA